VVYHGESIEAANRVEAAVFQVVAALPMLGISRRTPGRPGTPWKTNLKQALHEESL
jgi:hypothetical protein